MAVTPLFCDGPVGAAGVGAAASPTSYPFPGGQGTVLYTRGRKGHGSTFGHFQVSVQIYF